MLSHSHIVPHTASVPCTSCLCPTGGLCPTCYLCPTRSYRLSCLTHSHTVTAPHAVLALCVRFDSVNLHPSRPAGLHFVVEHSLPTRDNFLLASWRHSPIPYCVGGWRGRLQHNYNGRSSAILPPKSARVLPISGLKGDLLSLIGLWPHACRVISPGFIVLRCTIDLAAKDKQIGPTTMLVFTLVGMLSRCLKQP